MALYMDSLNELISDLDIPTQSYIKALTNFPFQSEEQFESVFKNYVDPKKMRKFVKIETSERVPLEAPFTMQSKIIEKNVLVKAEAALNGDFYDQESTSGLSTYSGDYVHDLLLENVDLAIGGLKILDDASFTIVRGKIYGLIGRNGVGKSTLLKAIKKRKFSINRRLKIYLVKQEIKTCDKSIIDFILYGDENKKKKEGKKKKKNDKNENKEISQKATDDLKKTLSNDDRGKTCGDNLLQLGLNKNLDENSKIENLEKINGMEKHEALKRVNDILNGLGFTKGILSRNVKDLSGGWVVRVNLARAIFLSPDLLLLDEPTNMLDIFSISWLEKKLQSINSTVILVSHDREFLNSVCSSILLLREFKITEYKGNYDSFIAERAREINNSKKMYEKQKAEREHIQSFIDRFRYNAKKASLVQSRIKLLSNMPTIKPVIEDPVMKFSFISGSVRGILVELKDIDFWYERTKKESTKNDTKKEIIENLDSFPNKIVYNTNPTNDLIFSKISLKIDFGTRIVVVGPNGAGKTTLLKILGLKLKPGSGDVIYNPNLKCSYFTQHHIDQLNLNDLVLGCLLKEGHPENKCRAALSRFGLIADTQKIATLSGGQKSRLAFARLSLCSPNLLLFDEPTNHLDIETIDALANALNSFEGAIVCVSHDLRFVENCFKEIWICNNGKIEFFNGGIRDYKKSL